MTWDKEVKKIKEREKLSLAQGGSESVKTQHKKGRKTLRERKLLVVQNIMKQVNWRTLLLLIFF